MDEDHYRSTYEEFVKTRCVFERSILARHCACGQAHKFNLAEREGVSCQASDAKLHCEDFYQFLRSQSSFVFHITDPSQPLPYAKQIKLQSGGLQSLAKFCTGDSHVHDIESLLTQARAQFPDWQQLPLSEIIQSISHFKVRHQGKSSD